MRTTNRRSSRLGPLATGGLVPRRRSSTTGLGENARHRGTQLRPSFAAVGDEEAQQGLRAGEVDAVNHGPPLAPRFDQPRSRQHRKVCGQGVVRRTQLSRQHPRSHAVGSCLNQPPERRQSRRLGEGAERFDGLRRVNLAGPGSCLDFHASILMDRMVVLQGDRGG